MTMAPPVTFPGTHLGRALWCLAGATLASLLVFAPLNFGSTRAGGIEVITWGCAGATLLWAAARLCGGPRAVLPLGAIVGITLFVLAALPWLSGLATPTPVAPFTHDHFARVAARWPYSLVWSTPAHATAFTVALAAAVLPLTDLARSPRWALTFSCALVGTAVGVAVIALLQNYTHAPGIYWRTDGRLPGNFSGTFYHHTAAGAYYNTAWPLALMLTWLARDHRGWRIVAGGATILLLAAHGSHVSRFPQLAALIVAPLLLVKLRLTGRGRGWLLGGGLGLIVLLVASAGRTATIAERWHLLLTAAPISLVTVPPPELAWPGLMRDDLFVPGSSHPGFMGDRRESWLTATRAIGERPLTGHSPGNWMGAASQHSDDPFMRTFFLYLQFAHQDALQFAVEWGVPAGLAGVGFLLGALVTGLRRHPGSVGSALGLAAACALGAVLMQSLIDFPLQMPAIALNVVVLATLAWAAGNADRTTLSSA